ncbi:MAG: hypothetical protein ACRDGA_12645, partial [Bacteroidota bacterium]
MTIDLPIVRFSVDWDNDGYINPMSRPGDILNIFPNPISLHGIDITKSAGSVVTRKNVQSDYGINAWELASFLSSNVISENLLTNG